MVAIKIQSKEDIIGAYLCSLGFAGRELPSIVKTVAGQLDFQSADGDELVGKIDGILLEMARKTFPESGLADEQLLQVKARIILEHPVHRGQDRAIGQPHLQPQHHGAGHAVTENTVPARIGGKVAADLARPARSDVEREHEAGLIRCDLNRFERGASLNHNQL